MPGLPRRTQFLNSTTIISPNISVPTSSSLPPPATLTTHRTLPMDATINITFGVFMAVLALIGICQAARHAALQTRQFFGGDQSNMQDVEMNGNVDAGAMVLNTNDVADIAVINASVTALLAEER